MAAGRAAELGADVLLLEKMPRPGSKMLLSGKTRCNLTNTRELSGFVGMFGPNGRFLHGAFHRFFREDLLALLARYGVGTQAERGGRVFPASGDARDVVNALARYVAEGGAELRTGVKVAGIGVDGGRVTGVETDAGLVPAGAVVLATGGASYATTGSTGDGYRMAAAVGHRIVKLRPALVPLVVREGALARKLQDLTLRNVRLTAWQCPAEAIDATRTPSSDCGRGIGGKQLRVPVIESRMGEMLFTHFGIAGPIVLLMSLAIVDALERGPVSVSIDLKPALRLVQLGRRLQRDFGRLGKCSLGRVLRDLLPRQMIEPLVELSGIPAAKPGHQVSAEERDRLAGLVKGLRFNIKAPLPLDAAIVTAGGVALDEIDPRTMASRLVQGLYFCGEVMDLDADTGGYNLQAAFSTGHVAGENAAEYARRALQR